jgi:hypothetical protein
VNPAHLELVTLLENNHRRRLDRRGELCPKGHVFVARGEQRSQAVTCQDCGLSYKDHLLSGAGHAFQGYASEAEIRAAQREKRRRAEAAS